LISFKLKYIFQKSSINAWFKMRNSLGWSARMPPHFFSPEDRRPRGRHFLAIAPVFCGLTRSFRRVLYLVSGRAPHALPLAPARRDRGFLRAHAKGRELMTRRSDRRIPILRTAMMAAPMLLQACSPYVTPDTPRPGYVPEAGRMEALEAKNHVRYMPGTTNLATAHVPLGAARAYAQFVQDSYQDALARQSRVRSIVNIAALGAALASVGLVLSNAGSDPLLYTTLAATGLGIGGQFLLTKDHETAYALGAKAVGCVVSAATDARPASLPLIGVQAALHRLRSAAAGYDAGVAEAEALGVSLGAAAGRPAAHFEALFVARSRQAAAGFSLEYGETYLQTVDVMGEQLVNRVEEIRLAVNDAVRRAEPDVLVLDKGLRSIIDQRMAGLTGPGVAPGAADALGTAQTNTTNFSRDFDGVFTPLQAAWDRANRQADAVDAASLILGKMIEAAGAATVRFDANVFAGCPMSALDGVAATPGVSVSPATTEIAAGADATVYAAITGRPPFQALANGLSQQAEVEGYLLRVPVKAAEARAGAVIGTPVSDLSGRAAVFQITVKAAAPVATRTAAPRIAAPAADALIKSDEVKNLQTKLEIPAPDGILGKATRTAMLASLKGQAGDVAARMGRPALMGVNCETATTALAPTLSGAPLDESEAAFKLTALYSDTALNSTSRVAQDPLLLRFYVDCGFL
jgi:hypothetical protein